MGFGGWFRPPYDSFAFADRLVGVQHDWWGDWREDFVLNADGTCTTHHCTGRVTVVDEPTIIARFRGINHKIKYKKIEDGYYVGTVVEPVRYPPITVTFGGEAPWYWNLPAFFVDGHVFGFPLPSSRGRRTRTRRDLLFCLAHSP